MKRKLAFWEIGKGKFAKQLQSEFENAQALAIERGAAVTITAKVTVNPPEQDDENFGSLFTEVKTSAPPIKSMKYTTELKQGAIIGDGEDLVDILQTELNLPENVIPIDKEKEGTNE